MAKEFINPPTVHRGGTYSHAVKVGNTIYVSGQVGRGPDGNVVSGGFAAQAERAFENLRLVLEAAGATTNDVVKLNTFLTDMANKPTYNEVRSRYFTASVPPSSTLLEISGLADPLYMIEVEAVAVVE
ncbi:MAG: RidA family protein [Chloroflexi bacterium]|nr:RidA family protein [Chloroflexota bacterium]